MKPHPPWCRCAPARSGAEAAPDGCAEAGAEAGLEAATAAAARAPSELSSAVASRRWGRGVPPLAEGPRRGGEVEVEAPAPAPHGAGEAGVATDDALGEEQPGGCRRAAASKVALRGERGKLLSTKSSSVLD